MSRKPRSIHRKPSRTAGAAGDSRDAKQPPVRLPQSWRTVTARKLKRTEAEEETDAPPRSVPEIRLSGAWLARVGFPTGRRYLISADRAFETIYLQAEVARKGRRRRR